VSAAAKFTPGPWHVHGANGNVVYAPDGWIADVRAGTKGSHGPAAQANANLIAAAPDLYAACKALIAYQESEEEWSILVATKAYESAVAMARAAIAKAEGASS
jgi:hypothetical protein